MRKIKKPARWEKRAERAGKSVWSAEGKFLSPTNSTSLLNISKFITLNHHHRVHSKSGSYCFAFQLVSIFYGKWLRAAFFCLSTATRAATVQDKQNENGRNFKRITKWAIWLQIRLQSRSISGSFLSDFSLFSSILILLFFTLEFYPLADIADYISLYLVHNWIV